MPDIPGIYWASNAPPVDAHDAALSHLETSAPVRLIATIGAFVAATADEPIAVAAERAKEGRFTFLPVRAHRDAEVVGLYRTGVPLKTGALTVGDVMEPLRGSNLIGANAPLLDFVLTADTSPCRLVLDRAEITGLVTLSDLQRLPVRTVLFGMFIHLELLLTEAIKRRFGKTTCPFDLLNEGDAKQPRGRWQRMSVAGMDRDPWGALDFGHKIKIAQNHELIGAGDGEGLHLIEKVIRHPIAHARDYAATPAAAMNVASHTRLMREWIERLRSEPLRQRQGNEN